MKVLSISSLVVCAAAISGCGQPETLSPDFGNAVRHNIATQIIDPEPPSAAAGAPDLAGERAGQAYGRYREGKVEEPAPISTTNGRSK